MAKKSTKVAFSKAEISFEKGKYIVTEVSKDESVSYNLSDVLNSFIGLSSISISIGVDDEVPEITEL